MRASFSPPRPVGSLNSQRATYLTSRHHNASAISSWVWQDSGATSGIRLALHPQSAADDLQAPGIEEPTNLSLVEEIQI